MIVTSFNLRKPHTWIPVLLFRRKKWVLWGQGLGKSSNPIVRFIRKTVINIASGYVVYTDEGKTRLIKEGVDESKITVAYNTLKIDNAYPTDGDKYLLYVGRLQERKGLIQVLAALTKLPFNLLIVGDGSYGQELRKYVRKHGLETSEDQVQSSS